MTRTVLDSSLAPFWFFFIPILGLVFGSFATALIARVPMKESLWTRSKCPHCAREILPQENIPVISFLLLKGKCRGCESKISVSYPLTELSMAALFIAPFIFPNTQNEITLWVIFSIFALPLTVIDIKLHRLPDILTGSLFLTSFVVILVMSVSHHAYDRLAPSVVGAVALAAFYFAIALISKGGMGLGDVKLSASVGLVSGYFGLNAVFVSSFAAFFCGSLIGLFLMAAKKANRKTPIPFGPFMILGQYVCFIGVALKLL